MNSLFIRNINFINISDNENKFPFIWIIKISRLNMT